MKKHILTILLSFCSFCVFAQCQPTYTVGCNAGKFVDSVFVGGVLSTIDNSSGCTGSLPNVVTTYFDTVCLISNHPISVGRTDTSLNIVAYIDYNHNGLFSDIGEIIFQIIGGSTLNTTGSFTVPTTAMYGVTKMRIVSADTLITNSCGAFTEGETEEYFVNILQPGPGPIICGCVSSTNVQFRVCDSMISPSANQVWTSSGNYVDTLVNANNCDSIVYASVTIDTLNDSIYSQSDTLWAVDSNALYQWYNCTSQSIITGQNMQFLHPMNSGAYACILSNANCIDTTNCLTYVPSNISENNLPIVTIYPNPVSDFIMVEAEKNSSLSIKIYDLMGIILKEKTLLNFSHKISLEDISPGIYLVELSSDRLLIRKKIIVK